MPIFFGSIWKEGGGRVDGDGGWFACVLQFNHLLVLGHVEYWEMAFSKIEKVEEGLLEVREDGEDRE